MAKSTQRNLSEFETACDGAVSEPAEFGSPGERLAAAARTMQSGSAEKAISPSVLEGLVRVAEFLIAMATGLAVHFIPRSADNELFYFLCIPLIAAFTVLALQCLGLYKASAFRNFPAEGLRLVAGILLAYGVVLAAIFSLKLNEIYSHFMLAWSGASLLVLTCERAMLALAVDDMIRTCRLARRAVLVGGGPAADTLLQQLAGQPQVDLQILGIFDDRTDERSPAVVAGFPTLGTVDDLIEFARRTRIDLIIFTLPITAEQRLLQMLRKLWILPIDIRLAAHMNKLRFRPHSYSYIGTVPLIDIFDKPIAGWDVIIKLCFDKIAGGLCLLPLSPLMAFVALAVKLDSKGPVLFKQERYGFNNQVIEIYKFRSLYTDKLDCATKPVTKNDPRVTRVGRVIRKTSIDELPQLFNVLFKGNLSLIGPRPHVLNDKAAEKRYDEAVGGYFAKHRVNTGITGWAQIHSWRGETDTPEKLQARVECDLYYIENWSILLDIYVLLVTPFVLLRNKNVY